VGPGRNGRLARARQSCGRSSTSAVPMGADDACGWVEEEEEEDASSEGKRGEASTPPLSRRRSCLTVRCFYRLIVSVRFLRRRFKGRPAGPRGAAPSAGVAGVPCWLAAESARARRTVRSFACLAAIARTRRETTRGILGHCKRRRTCWHACDDVAWQQGPRRKMCVVWPTANLGGKPTNLPVFEIRAAHRSHTISFFPGQQDRAGRARMAWPPARLRRGREVGGDLAAGRGGGRGSGGLG
jgi:hypothetical protein